MFSRRSSKPNSLRWLRDNVASLEVQRKNAEANYRRESPLKTTYSRRMSPCPRRSSSARSTVKQFVILRSTLNQLLISTCRKKSNWLESSKEPTRSPNLHQLYSAAKKNSPNTLLSKRQSGKPNTPKRLPRPLLSACLRVCPILPGRQKFFTGDNNPYANNYNAAVGLKSGLEFVRGGKKSFRTRMGVSPEGNRTETRRPSPENPAPGGKRLRTVKCDKSKYRHYQGRLSNRRKKTTGLPRSVQRAGQ